MSLRGVGRELIKSFEVREITKKKSHKRKLFIFSDLIALTNRKKDGQYKLVFKYPIKDIATLPDLDNKRNVVPQILILQSPSHTVNLSFEKEGEKQMIENLILTHRSITSYYERPTKGESQQIKEAKLLKDQQTRERIILEIIETEEKYLEDLLLLKEVYLDQIEQRNLLTEFEKNTLFGSIQSLYDLNKTLCLDPLVNAIEETKERGNSVASIQVGDILHEFV